jgi:hypothetical protein
MIKRDSFVIGFVPALIAPVLGAYIFYLIFFCYMELNNFIAHIIKSDKWVSVLSVGAILNLALFLFFYHRQNDRSAKGVLSATFVYAFIVIYFKAF